MGNIYRYVSKQKENSIAAILPQLVFKVVKEIQKLPYNWVIDAENKRSKTYVFL